MIEASATATLPVPPRTAFAVVSDISNADWLPAVRGVRHLGGPKRGVGARFEVEAGMVGRHLRGVLLVKEMVEPKKMVLVLEEGLDLTITIEVAPRGRAASCASRPATLSGALSAGPWSGPASRRRDGRWRGRSSRSPPASVARMRLLPGADDNAFP